VEVRRRENSLEVEGVVRWPGKSESRGNADR